MMNGISDRSASEMLVCTCIYNIVANDWRITFSMEACSLHKNSSIKNFAHFGYMLAEFNYSVTNLAHSLRVSYSHRINVVFTFDCNHYRTPAMIIVCIVNLLTLMMQSIIICFRYIHIIRVKHINGCHISMVIK